MADKTFAITKALKQQLVDLGLAANAKEAAIKTFIGHALASGELTQKRIKRLMGARLTERHTRVSELRRQGFSFSRIAEEIGMSRQRAHQLWQQFNRMTAEPAGDDNR